MPIMKGKKMSCRMIDYQLLFAYELGDTAEVEELKAVGAKEAMKVWYDQEKLTALMVAVLHDDLPAAQMLIKMNADLNMQDENGETALMHAVKSKNLATVKLCLQHGAQMHVRNKKGQSALDLARSLKCAEVVKILSALEKGGKQKPQRILRANKNIQKNVQLKEKQKCR